MKLITYFLCPVVLLFIQGCEGKIITEADIQSDTIKMELTFSEIQTEVFTLRCATSGCHTGLNPQQGLNLSSGMAYSNIFNITSTEMPSSKLIFPGNSADSYLIRKIRGQNISGSRMPRGRAPLSNALIDAMAEWVDRGASNN